MAFRYINPGYAEPLIDTGATTTESFTYNTTNGISFSAYSKTIQILPAGKVAGDFFCKFDLYCDGDSQAHNFYLGLPRYDALNNATWIAGIEVIYDKIYTCACSYKIGNGVSLKRNDVNKIFFHINMSEATFTLTANGIEQIANSHQYVTASNMQEYYAGKSPVTIFFPSNSYSTCRVSNLILSDEEISPKEQIIALPASATVTDMTAGENGIYIADKANQTLFQTVDMSTLIENYGASSTVTGISLVGSPAYATAAGLTSLISLTKSGTSIIEHETYALSDDTTAGIIDGWSTENMTIADLQDMQFGWKVGT